MSTDTWLLTIRFATPWNGSELNITHAKNVRLFRTILCSFQGKKEVHVLTESSLERPITNHISTWNGPRQANLVLIAYASSEGSSEPAHPRSLARTFAARSYKQWSKRNLQTENQTLAPLNGWACAVKICHDGMLEDTNSLDGAQMWQVCSFDWEWCHYVILLKQDETAIQKYVVSNVTEEFLFDESIFY